VIKSRERVRLALNHKESDRIPIDFGAFRSSGIAAIAYNRLRKKLGVNSKLPRMYDFIQQLAFPEKEIMDMFHVDVIDAAQSFLKEDSNWRNWTLDDGSKCLIPKNLNIEIDKDQNVYLKNNEGITLGKKPKSSLYVDQSWRPYESLNKIPEKVTDEDVVREMWSTPGPEWTLDIYDDNQYGKFIDNIKTLYEDTDYAIILTVGCNLFEKGTYLRNFENFLVDIYIDKKGVERLHAKLMERYMKLLDRVIKGVGDYVDVLAFGGDDLGSNDSGFMSPDIFRELFKPKYKKMWDFVHDNSNCKVFLHSCGSIYEYIPDLIDAGVDILNPVQTNAANMEPEKLKREFGKYVTFWGGGVDTRNVLPSKSPDEVKEDVKKRIEIFGRGGGFVFNQIHNILADVPPENVIAMLEAAYEYGQYKK
jgi:uroporphyrinogen decarboxylase